MHADGNNCRRLHHSWIPVEEVISVLLGDRLLTQKQRLFVFALSIICQYTTSYVTLWFMPLLQVTQVEPAALHPLRSV